MAKNLQDLKRQAAERAVQFVTSGMVIGLGHGTTAALAISRIAQLMKAGELRDLRGLPCSQMVERRARELGIPVSTLDEHPQVDLTIDGADEVDPHLDLIKGGGGALLREKMVAQASRREIIVVDESKLSPVLGKERPVPVEVVPFSWRAQRAFLKALGAEVRLRQVSAGVPFLTDEGHYILDCVFGPMSDPSRIARQLQDRAGIVEHGLFLGLATDVIVATGRGIRHLKRARV